MKISEIMNTHIYSVDYELSIKEAAGYMKDYKIGGVMVTKKNRYIGIITERDILTKVVALGKNANEVLVKKIMTSKLIAVSADSSLIDANELMVKHHIRRLPVSKNKQIVGFISIREVSNYLISDLVSKTLRCP